MNYDICQWENCSGGEHCKKHSLLNATEQTGWDREKLYEKYKNHGDERFGTVKSENTGLEGLLDEVTDIILFEKAKSYEEGYTKRVQEEIDGVQKSALQFVRDDARHALLEELKGEVEKLPVYYRSINSIRFDTGDEVREMLDMRQVLALLSSKV